MMKKSLKKGNRIFFLIVLFYAVYVIYLYNNPNDVNATDLVEVSGLLLKKPKYEEANGDNVPNITFRLIGDSRVFKIESCGLQEVDFDTMMNLNPRDSINFKIKHLKQLNAREKINSDREVFDIRISNVANPLLSLNDYNSCEKNVWKELLLVTILMVITMAFTVGTRLINQKIKR